MIRNHPQWQQARAWVQDGRIGDLVSVQTAFSYFNRDAANIRNQKDAGGGALYDIGCYAVNTSRFLFGREPVRAVALVERDAGFGTDRLTSGMLDFGGAHLTFTVSTQAVSYQRVNAFGTKGRIEIEVPFNAPADRPCRIFLDDGSKLGGASAEVTAFPVVDQYHLQAEAFSRAIRTGGAIENSIEVAVGNMRVIDALFRSADSGGWEEV
jgi:predicted dehydrogenase